MNGAGIGGWRANIGLGLQVDDGDGSLTPSRYSSEMVGEPVRLMPCRLEMLMRYRDLRLASDAHVSVTIGATVHVLSLVNVSTSGARFTTSERLVRDAGVLIGYLDVRIPARVAWSNGRETAVRFASPLSIAEMTALRREASRSRGQWSPGGPSMFREMA